MPALLTGHDVAELARVHAPAWRRRFAPWAIFLLGLIILVVLVNGSPTVPCTEANPCRPDPFSWIEVGLVFSSLFVAFLLPWAAGVLAAVAVVVLAWGDRLHPDQAFPAGTIGLAVFAVAALGIAWWGQHDPGRAAIEAWSYRVGRLTAPAAFVPTAGRLARLGGVVLLLIAGGCAWIGIERQRQADAQQRAASVVVARVEQHVDDFTLRVSRPGGDPLSIGVADAANYPVGQQIRLAIDDNGLAQPLSEPYDAGGWHLVATMAAAFGVALFVRGWRRQARVRALVREPQPATRALHLGAHLYVGDARPGDLAFAQLVPVGPVLSPQRPPDVDTDAEDGESPMPLTLYGSPVIGSEVLLVHNDVVVRARLKPPGMEGVLAAEGLPLSTVDPQILPASEATASVETTHVHRKNPLLGYALAAAMPLAAVHLFRLLGPGPIAWALAIALAAVAGVAGWRLWIRPLVAWNAGGVAVVGVIGRRRMAWPEVKQVAIEGETVVILPRDAAGFALGAQLKRGGRTALSVREGLEYARARYTPSVEPPDFPGSAAAWPLIPLLAGVALFLVWWGSI